ncbi:ClC family H(+)/Cl(-) exchange transporter [Secundilactobacillus folii]|uniref:ClC family H(+)/Cl(-) exchange transporter n=1 Tax=Secundilactobacillus folii TaxID=2678357 RepID=A0A7X2XVM6_9LACO|nr:ClC family H(+)/Cl(-) exchange transporter [Secundilactobacillus folii]MTV82451.1 ClC family H(+)/Cl(-) exchange transporter [Secundilactobacillus folii]
MNVLRHKKWDFTRINAVLQGILIGLIAGFIVSTFRLLISHGLKLVQWFFHLAKGNLWLLLIWVVFSVILTLLIGRWLKTTPEITGSGIPQVEGQLMGEVEYHWWPVLWKKFVGGVLAIGSGLFLGREGPSIQLGATVGQGFAESRKITGNKRRTLIASGASAGLSAAFNAPIASSLFILEEVYHNFSTMIWITALASAIAADFVSTFFFGLTPVLHITYVHPLPLTQYGWLVILGLLLGLFGRLYQVVVLRVGEWYHRIKWLPDQYNSLIAFLLLIPVGLFIPQILGGGNQLIVSIGGNAPTAMILLVVFIVRFVYSMISYGTGLPGGIFLPILTLGAVLGALFGQLLVSWHLASPAVVPIFTIAAMAGYFAGISKAPFTAILLITEMVGTLQHLMPLALVSLIAYLTVDVLGGAPVYAAMLEKFLQKSHTGQTVPVTQLEFPVFENAVLDGKQVRDVDWPDGALLVEIKRGEKIIVPHGDTEIRLGDTLLLSVPQKYLIHVRHVMMHLSGN